MNATASSEAGGSPAAADSVIFSLLECKAYLLERARFSSDVHFKLYAETILAYIAALEKERDHLSDALLKSQSHSGRQALEISELRRLAPLCKEHGTGEGTRSGCPYCALSRQHADDCARIDQIEALHKELDEAKPWVEWGNKYYAILRTQLSNYSFADEFKALEEMPKAKK